MSRISKARPEDGPAISTIMSSWIDETDWMPKVHTLEEFRNYGAWLISASDVVVASVQNQVVGFTSRQESDIQALYLTPSHRSCGIGQELLDAAKLQVRELGLWTFQANKRAQAFYRRNGFVEDKRTHGADNDEKLPDVHFIWVRVAN
jgi:GNAT superfamily N-acetyltransferase